MKNKRAIFYAVLLILFICSILSTLILNIILKDMRLINEPLHSAIEAIGSMAAVVMAIILLQGKDDKNSKKYFLLAMGFLSMGILDGFHVISKIGRGFILLHSLACLIGGLWFSSLWLPGFGNYISKKKRFSLTFAAGIVLTGILIIQFRELFPVMVHNGKFTFEAIAINLCAGILSLAAALYFLLEFNRSNKIESYLFTCLFLLFGLSELSFPFSSLWDAQWWFWHLERLIAYIIVLYYLFYVFQRSREDFRVLSLSLEQQVAERTSKLTREIAERMKSEEALSALTLRYEAILSAVPDIIMEVDSNRVYTWANIVGHEFFGDDVIGKEAAFYFEGEQKTYSIVEPLFKGREDVIYVESWQRRKDGEKRLLAWWCRVLKDSSGNVIGALSTARDISEIKQAEEEVRQLNKSYERLTDNADEAIFRVEAKGGHVIYCNPAAERIFGYSLAEWQADPALGFKLIHPDYREKQKQIIEQINNNKQSVKNVELGWISKDGRTVLVEYSIIPICNAKGEIIFFESIGKDITERKQIEEALRKSEALLQETQRISKVGGWEYDIENKKLTWTEEVYRIYEVPLDYDPNNIQNDIQFYAPDARKTIETAFYNAVEKGETYDLELPFITAKANHLWVRTIGKADIRDGRPVRVFGNIMDITEQKKAGEELNKYRKHLEELVKERTTELEEKTAKLERLNKVFVGRELRMIELKEKIKELEGQV